MGLPALGNLKTKSFENNIEKISRVIKILYIEDNKTDCKQLVQGLDSYARERDLIIKVKIAVRVLDAEILLKTEQFDFILTDLFLIDFKGVEVIKKLKQITDVPIVALSGIYDSEVTEDVILAGAEDFLLKGANGYDRILRCILNTLNRQKRYKKIEGKFRELGIN